MPSALPDPVLALSLANVQKLNHVDVDQLANLWNVFTKCKESLESGRRLENLSWRLWFREAHLLPADTSLSDLTDYTPLDTPLMSRRGSVTGNGVLSRPTLAAVSYSPFQALLSVDGQHSSSLDHPLSDPEDGAWSSDDDKTNKSTEKGAVHEPKDIRGRTPTRSEASMSETDSTSKDVPLQANASVQSSLKHPSITSTRPAAVDNLPLQTEAPLHGATLAIPDRKRAVSSSSAFGSRARVKQHNTVRRRRPLSFQQAIEGLLLDRSRDFYRDGTESKPFARQPSLSLRTADIGVDTNGNNWRADALAAEVTPESSLMQQNSAPAEFSQPSTPSVNISSPPPAFALDSSRLEAERRVMPPPLGVPGRMKVEAASQKDSQIATKRKESKFFMAGQSVDDGPSSVGGNYALPQQFPSREELHDPSQLPMGKRAPSEAASDRSQRSHASNASNRHTHAAPKSTQHSNAVVGRNRSAVGLNRAGALAAGRGKGHGRVASGLRGLNTMVKPSEEREAHTTTQKHKNESEEVVVKQKDAATTEKGRPPVKFIMGGGDDDEDEFTDDDSEEEVQSKPSQASRGAANQQKKGKAVEEEDEWSSASSTDSEEVRRQTAVRRRREEAERQQAMFQKKPIKSASTVDVRNMERRSSAPMEPSNSRESPLQQPVRGLLSSLFHPEEDPHPPPGQLAGRPHASAADLRQRPARLSDSRPQAEQGVAKMRDTSAIPSTTQVPSIGGGALKLSKSAVALPVLSTMGSRSEAKGSRDTEVFDDEESGEGSEGDLHGPSEALVRLNQLAHQKQEQQRQGKRQSTQRHSNSSLNIQVAPEIDEEAMRADKRERRREAVATPSLSSYRSGSNVPEMSMPQTPRTTRRNMLRDELSESLRQNLLWERQSRNRMLGIGTMNNNPRTQAAVDSRSRSQVAPTSRNQSVLGGGPLRPLTSSSSVTNMGDQQQRPTNRQQNSQLANNQDGSSTRSYTGDFHHTGW